MAGDRDRRMTVAVIQFPGSNRDQDMIDTVASVSGKAPLKLWHAETKLPEGVEAVILPGGFSYGDYLRCGAIAARSPILGAVSGAAAAGMPVLGVCNGFQILLEAGLLPGALMRNASLRFVCRTVELKVESNRSTFLRQFGQGVSWPCPVAHGDGNYLCDADTLLALKDNDQIALTYSEETNPNGSLANIAGITNRKGNVMGLMPHPENVSLPHQSSQVGRALFESFLNAA